MNTPDNELWNQLVDVIVENVGLSKEQILPESKLIEDFSCEPLDMAELVIAIEEKFGVIYPDEDWENAHTVRDIYDYLESHKETK